MARAVASGRVATSNRSSESGRLAQRNNVCVSLSGLTGYVSRTTQNVYNNSTYSVSFFVKGAAQTDATIYAEGSGSNPTPVLLIGTGNTVGNNNKLSVFIRNDATTSLLSFTISTKTVFDSAWHHVVWVDDNGTCSLYIDGVKDPTNYSYTRSGVFTLTRTSFGARVRNTVSNHFTGSIYDLRTFTSALTQAQARALGVGIIPANNNLAWKMDEGSGLVANDSTGNGNTGTLTATGISYVTDSLPHLRTLA